jgi:hypothetical protein
MVVVNGNSIDLNDPVTPPPAATLEKSIYFTSIAPASILTDNAQYYTGLNVAPVVPGSYAVIGPGEPPGTQTGNGTLHRIAVGRKTGDTDAAPYDGNSNGGTRYIALDPSQPLGPPLASFPPNFTHVAAYNNSTSGFEPPAPPVDTKPATAIVINAPRPLSTSEPAAGYPAPNLSSHGVPDASLAASGESSPAVERCYQPVHYDRRNAD